MLHLQVTFKLKWGLKAWSESFQLIFPRAWDVEVGLSFVKSSGTITCSVRQNERKNTFQSHFPYCSQLLNNWSIYHSIQNVPCLCDLSSKLGVPSLLARFVLPSFCSSISPKAWAFLFISLCQVLLNLCLPVLRISCLPEGNLKWFFCSNLYLEYLLVFQRAVIRSVVSNGCFVNVLRGINRLF